MFVYSLCRQLCPDKLPVQPVERLGDGADGEVLSIKDQPDKVIKLGIIYEHPGRELKEYKQIQQVLDYAMSTHPPAFVRVYEHGYLGTYSRKIVEWRKDFQEFLMYYYIMEKLEKITEDEKKYFIVSFPTKIVELKRIILPKKLKKCCRVWSGGLTLIQKRLSYSAIICVEPAFCTKIFMSGIS